jgi:hypothetical protein
MNDDLDVRTFKAYNHRFGLESPIPCSNVEYYEHQGKDYAVLSNINGILAIYRIMSDESLKCIKIDWFNNNVLGNSEES